MERLFNKKTAFFAVSAVVLFKIFLSAALELHPDEAYYWLWAQHLALGYYDHSPMVAYFIKLTTLFSDSEFFVRFSSLIVTVVLSVFTWKFAKKLFGETVASASVIIVNTLPLMMVASVIITPDTPVFLFYSLSVYFLYSLIETGKIKYWYITGLFFGLAMLSKYTAVLFALCLLVYMISAKKLVWFKNLHFYMMFVTALAVFMPVVIWNSQNSWISFTYQLNHGLYNSKLNFGYIFEYLGAQCLVAGPFIFIAGLFAAFKAYSSKDPKKIFLASFSVPVIAFFIFTALKRLPGANWPAFAYFTFCIMAAQYLLSDVTKLKKRVLIIGIAFNVFVSVLLGLHAKYSIFPLHMFSEKAAVADATNWFTGWREFGKKLSGAGAKYVVTHSHQWGGAIAYYTRGKIKAVIVDSDRPNQFAYWPIPDDLSSAKTAYVRIDNRMEEDFTEIPDAEAMYAFRNGLAIRQYALTVSGGYEMTRKRQAH